MQKTYIIYCTMSHPEKYTTLVLTGTEEACVDWLRNHVEAADGSPASTMQAYLEIVREYMEENGGCALWQVTCDGIQLEQFVNDYEWHDTWELEGEGNYQTLIINV